MRTRVEYGSDLITRFWENGSFRYPHAHVYFDHASIYRRKQALGTLRANNGPYA
jgi:hypothetical protein